MTPRRLPMDLTADELESLAFIGALLFGMAPYGTFADDLLTPEEQELAYRAFGEVPSDDDDDAGTEEWIK